MNERINELWARAVDAAVPETYTSLSWAQIEKIKLVFAQLIVQECMQVVHNGINNATDWDSSSWDQCCENRMYAIQKHFGVEQ